MDSASGALTPSGVGVSLANGKGALVLQTIEAADGSVTTKYGFVAEGDVALEGVPRVTLSADDLIIAYNRWGDDLAVDVETASGTYSVNLVDNETRLRGYMNIGVADAIVAQGNLFMEAREDQSILLADGSTVTGAIRGPSRPLPRRSNARNRLRSAPKI